MHSSLVCVVGEWGWCRRTPVEGGSARENRERPFSSEGLWQKNSTYRLFKLWV